ncbi:hypothetical protein BN2475_190144 [Paraburkholderia ribeironis]|uniref:Uncharacterized protein n=1 Tax=Paraburkholderia ribeironis TaxID=1247936 RepID=A0A1N7RVW2_9BURK|nr:hypothetical protein BN2475_190144 [Paraburkholderia ribeironis]
MNAKQGPARPGCGAGPDLAVRDEPVSGLRGVLKYLFLPVLVSGVLRI